jgi:hypothetical protein
MQSQKEEFGKITMKLPKELSKRILTLLKSLQQEQVTINGNIYIPIESIIIEFGDLAEHLSTKYNLEIDIRLR